MADNTSIRNNSIFIQYDNALFNHIMFVLFIFQMFIPPDNHTVPDTCMFIDNGVFNKTIRTDTHRNIRFTGEKFQGFPIIVTHDVTVFDDGAMPYPGPYA